MLNAIFVIFGAALWATDTLFRQPMTHEISVLSIVFLEHVFAVMIAAVWVFAIERKKMEHQWLAILGAALVGVLGSAFATIFFTMSFEYVNPSVSILLQKTQPIVVIFLSWLFLGEKLSIRFFLWGALAMAAAFFLSFPHGLVEGELQIASIKGVILALAASMLWAVSTIIGKATLKKMSGSHLTLWRFFFGLAALWALVMFVPQSKIEIPFVVADSKVLRSIFFMALVPGFLGVNLYYRGLTRLKASVATLLELAFPLCAIFVNSQFLDLHLENTQLVAAAVLIFAILRISRINA